jgi:undecaprenyl-diphosphatase
MSQLFEIDREIFYFIHVVMRRDFLDPIFLAITHTGTTIAHFIIAIPFFFKKELRVRAVLVVFSGFVSFLACIGVRLFISRARPSALPFAHPLEPIYGMTSFPSGHASTSFGAAFMLFFLCKNTPYRGWGWFALLWALLVGVSRIYIGVHFPSDILGGALLGWLVAKILYSFWKRGQMQPQEA